MAPERVCHVSVMPCFDKKLEAARDDFFNALQGVLSTHVDDLYVGGTQSFVDAVLDLKMKIGTCEHSVFKYCGQWYKQDEAHGVKVTMDFRERDGESGLRGRADGAWKARRRWKLSCARSCSAWKRSVAWCPESSYARPMSVASFKK